jgi:hypothetical protein
MTGIDDRIAEMREMAIKLRTHKLLPDCPSLATVCETLREVLKWIKEHDDD